MNTPNPFIEEAVKEFEEKFSNYCGQGGFMWDNGNLNVDAVKAFFGSKLTLAMDEGEAIAKKAADAEKQELADALIGMYEQYCTMGHDFMSAGEAASTVLGMQGYATFDETGRMLQASNE